MSDRAIIPRKWQEKALQLWLQEMRGIVAAVTGAGKTTYALLCIQHFRQKYSNGRVVVLVPTIALADQWAVEIIGELGESMANITGLAKALKGNKADFIISVLNSARNKLENIASDQPTLLVVDECHRTGSEQNSLALKGGFVATLGLSATPERQYDDGFLKYITPVLGKIIYTYNYGDAYEDRVIVPFDLINVKFPLSSQEQEEYDKLTKRIALAINKRDADHAQVEALLRMRSKVSWLSRLRVPIAAKLVIQHAGQRIIVFHESVHLANELLGILIKRGIMATIYHSKLPREQRQENLLLYKNGYYSCLVCCRALDEGLNVPSTSVAVIASSTSSIRQRIQRLGRVLRHATTKSKAIVYTLYATPPEQQRLKNEAVKMSSIAEIKWLALKTDGENNTE